MSLLSTMGLNHAMMPLSTDGAGTVDIIKVIRIGHGPAIVDDELGGGELTKVPLYSFGFF